MIHETKTDKRKEQFGNPKIIVWDLNTIFILFIYFFTTFSILFYFYFFYFTILYWFCHTSTWIHHGCTRVPHPEPPSHLLPHTIPLGHPSAPAPSILYHASNLDWQFVSHMILYMFQCHSWIPLLIMNRPSMQISKERENLDSSVNKLNVTYSYRWSTQWQCNILFSQVYMRYSLTYNIKQIMS